jgi:putative ABC transport system permease protein
VINRMIVSNILHRPVRTAVSILAVGIEVAMIMLVVGLTHGMLDESAKRVEGVGADILVQPPNASFLFGLSSAPVPIKIADRLREQPHVKAVAPVMFNVNTTAGFSVIYGIDMASFDAVTGGFVYHSGGPLKNPHDVLIDDIYARANHLKVGDTMRLLNHDFTVVGVVEHGKGSRIFIPLETAQEVANMQDKASIFYVRLTDRGYTDDTMDSIMRLLPGYKVLSIDEYMSMMTSNNLPGMDKFNHVMIGLAAVIGFMVIFLSMYTTITERTREIGILKSLGASKVFIIQAILRESSLMALVGIGVGYLGAELARKGMLAVFPTLTIELTAEWGAYAAILAIIGSLVGAFYPALKAARLDPVDALAYE